MSENYWMTGKECSPWSESTFCSVWSGSTLFAVCLLKISIRDIFFRNPVFKRISPKFNSKKIKLDFTIFFFLHTHVVGTHRLGLLQYIVTEIQSVVAESGCRKYRKCNYYMGCVCVHLCVWGRAGLSGSVGCAVRLETRRSQVQPPPEVSNILSWRLIMKYFLRSFSPFRWFKKGSCQFLAKECAQYWLTA